MKRLENKVDELQTTNRKTSSKYNIFKVKHSKLNTKLIKEKKHKSLFFKKKDHSYTLPIFFSDTNKLVHRYFFFKWTDNNIAAALSLRSLSPKAYRFIRLTWKLPLPGVSTLNKWVKDVNVEPGHLNISLRIMKMKGQSMTNGEKACVLSFDEMKLDESFYYDKGAGRIYGPRKYVQVVVARSIIGKW